jgi:DNA-binding NarL/FixJ family response regulator
MADATQEPLIHPLVADDQRVIREGLSLILSLLPGVEIVGAATDGEDAVRQALSVAPDVVLMDLTYRTATESRRPAARHRRDRASRWWC